MQYKWYTYLKWRWEYMLIYCKKCGSIYQYYDYDKDKPCRFCKSKLYNVPDEYYPKLNGEIIRIVIDNKEKFLEECVKSSPEFDPKLFEEAPLFFKKKSQEMDRAIKIGSAIRAGADPKLAFKNGGQNLPKCPACGSLNVKKIGGVERAASVGFFGLFSKKIGKTFECKNCGMMF